MDYNNWAHRVKVFHSAGICWFSFKISVAFMFEFVVQSLKLIVIILCNSMFHFYFTNFKKFNYTAGFPSVPLSQLIFPSFWTILSSFDHLIIFFLFLEIFLLIPTLYYFKLCGAEAMLCSSSTDKARKHFWENHIFLGDKVWNPNCLYG